jgi:hypothetical protein
MLGDTKRKAPKSSHSRPKLRSRQPLRIPTAQLYATDDASIRLATLQHRLRVYDEWARHADEHYVDSLFVGDPKQVLKQFSDYVEIQNTIFERTKETIDEIRRCIGVDPDNATLLSRMWIEHAQRNISGHAGAVARNDNKVAEGNTAKVATRQESPETKLQSLLRDLFEKAERQEACSQTQSESTAAQEKQPIPTTKRRGDSG